MRVYPMKEKGRIVYSVVYQYRSKRFAFTPKGKLRTYFPAGACWFDARQGDAEGLGVDFATLEATLRSYRAGSSRCKRCEGIGTVRKTEWFMGEEAYVDEECTTCSGSGVVPSAPPAPEGTDGNP